MAKRTRKRQGGIPLPERATASLPRWLGHTGVNWGPARAGGKRLIGGAR